MFAVRQVGYLAVWALFLLIHEGFALKCYTCTNVNDIDCGSTFTLRGPDKHAALLECKGANAACRKIVSDDTPDHLVLVTRGCFVMAANVTMDTMSCIKIFGTSKSCYCNTDGCNSQTANVASLAIVFTSLIIFLVFKL